MKLISSFWTVMIISVSVAVIFLAYGFFHEFRPLKTQADYDNGLAEQLEANGNLLKKAQDRKKRAIGIVKEKTAQWNVYVATRTPPASVRQGGIDVSVDPYRLSIDTWTFRNNIQRAVNAQLKRGGVKLISAGPEVPFPSDINNVGGLLSSYYNYPGIKFPVVIFNLGQIQVQGTYEQIMEHIRSYKTMPNYLAVTDGLRLDGTAPLLTGTYQLAIVGFIRGKTVFNSVPEQASATTAGGVGGGFGPPAGFGPPGGMGGRGPAGPGGGGRGGPVAPGMAGMAGVGGR